MVGRWCFPFPSSGFVFSHGCGAVAKDPLPPSSPIATALASLLPSPDSARSSLPIGAFPSVACGNDGAIDSPSTVVLTSPAGSLFRGAEESPPF
ncbi:hypothetical protein B296_00036497 [Ensete ventricosum]|uniref:Uncharacterized protein n=1 Tax=Ensete ventricosum TaxID=4639 RepID=A0A426Z594_ENSVE|nr:hypothetical protein B296_00036497 [Ensete ventricosum]